MKTWTIKIMLDDNNQYSMQRDNDGFNLMELIGFTEVLRDDLLGFLKGKTKIDEIKRTATDTTPGARE